jgi:acetolactate synthase regulatory subunit
MTTRMIQRMPPTAKRTATGIRAPFREVSLALARRLRKLIRALTGDAHRGFTVSAQAAEQVEDAEAPLWEHVRDAVEACRSS